MIPICTKCGEMIYGKSDIVDNKYYHINHSPNMNVEEK